MAWTVETLNETVDAERGIAGRPASEQRVVILRAFVKKTEKTPAGEIELALKRAKELRP